MAQRCHFQARGQEPSWAPRHTQNHFRTETTIWDIFEAVNQDAHLIFPNDSKKGSSLISLQFEQCDLKFPLTFFSNNHQCAEGFQGEKTICYHEDFILSTITLQKHTQKGLRRALRASAPWNNGPPWEWDRTEAFSSPTKDLTTCLPSAHLWSFLHKSHS